MTNPPTRRAIQAFNLALDIYSQKKDYSSLIAKSNSWIEQEVVRKDSAIQKEFDEIVKIKKQAQFEYATSLGTDAKALDIFKDFCFKAEFKDKSCTNAKVLAVKMSDQKGLGVDFGIP